MHEAEIGTDIGKMRGLRRHERYSKINAAGGILVSEYLPYVSLAMSSGMKAEWFDPDKMIIIPYKSIDLTAVVDTITPEYGFVREKGSDIPYPR